MCEESDLGFLREPAHFQMFRIEWWEGNVCSRLGSRAGIHVVIDMDDYNNLVTVVVWMSANKKVKSGQQLRRAMI